MRVRCKKSWNNLKSLRLGQSNTRLVRDLLSLTEKLALLLQNITFLRRCKCHGIIPNFIDHLFNLPEEFSQRSRPLRNTKRQMLTHSIRSCFRDVYVTKKAIAKIEAEIPISVRPQIQPIVVMARKNAKSARKRTLIAKFERLEKRKESQQPWGGRSNVFKVTQPSAERVSVLDDIEVSPTAIGILAKDRSTSSAPHGHVRNYNTPFKWKLQPLHTHSDGSQRWKPNLD